MFSHASAARVLASASQDYSGFRSLPQAGDFRFGKSRQDHRAGMTVQPRSVWLPKMRYAALHASLFGPHSQVRALVSAADAIQGIGQARRLTPALLAGRAPARTRTCWYSNMRAFPARPVAIAVRDIPVAHPSLRLGPPSAFKFGCPAEFVGVM